MLEGLRGALDVRGRWIQVECSLVLGAVGASSELAARGDVVSDETMDLCHLVRPKASGECFMELIMEATCPCRVWCFRSVATPGVLVAVRPRSWARFRSSDFQGASLFLRACMKLPTAIKI